MERSILFSTTMVDAIRADRKTVTRRTITARSPPACPYGPPGTRLWLKEDFYAYGYWESKYSLTKQRQIRQFVDMTLKSGQRYQHMAPEAFNSAEAAGDQPAWWRRPGRSMPRKASRHGRSHQYQHRATARHHR